MCDCSQGYSECMRRRCQVDLHSFDPELERTLHRLYRELRTAQNRNLAIMQNNEDHDLGHDKNEPQRDRNGNNGRNHAPRLFIQPDDSFMLLEEFPTTYSCSDGHPKTTYSGKQLRVEVSNLTDASEHPVPRIAQ